MNPLLLLFVPATICSGDDVCVVIRSKNCVDVLRMKVKRLIPVAVNVFERQKGVNRSIRCALIHCLLKCLVPCRNRRDTEGAVRCFDDFRIDLQVDQRAESDSKRRRRGEISNAEC